jgi:hypothetical protein
MTGPVLRRALGSLAPADLAEPRLLAHHAAQWLARAARAVIEPVPDDSHTSLVWDPQRFALVGPAFAAEGGEARLGIRIPDLALLAIRPDDSLAMYPVDGGTDADAGKWMAEQLSALGLDGTGLGDDLPYELPAHGVGAGETYDAATNVTGLMELSIWFDLSSAVVADIAGKFAHLQPGPSPVRCWPHHFDVATLISLDAGGGEDARSVGVGLSPGDEGYPQPYFYVTPWPYPEADALPALEGGGHWHTEGWIGAVLTGDTVAAAGDAEAQQEAAIAFAETALGACLALLGVQRGGS